MGIEWIATTVNSNNPKPKFYGKRLRRVKGHYFWLRRTLQERAPSSYGEIQKY